ncbi:MAG: sulfotransferase [Pseudomonadota bacterium]
MARRRLRGKQDLFGKNELIADAHAASQVDVDYDLDSEALDALLDAMRAALDEMNLLGGRRAHRMMGDVLVKQLRLAHFLQNEPGVADTPIERPIFLVGPPRSGTTFLHRLLAQDPAHRTPRLWEVMQPPPPTPALRGDPAYFDNDYRVPIARKFLEARARFSPRMASIHSTDVNAPEECFGLLETTLHSHSFLFCAPVFDYIDWLDTRSDAAWLRVYAQYADQLRLLQWWHPGERWVLKSPFHMWAVDALCATFPDAVIVQQHRDPLACVASFCSLTETAFATITTGISRERIGRLSLRYLRDALRRNVDARNALPSDRFIDIPYTDLVKDPLAAVHRVYAAAGLEPSDTAQARIEGWLTEQAKSRDGTRHDYDLTDFGLSKDEILDAFAPYMAFAENR